MSFSWNGIHRSLLLSSSTLTFGRAFATMRDQHPVARQYTDVTALLDQLHHGSVPSGEKNDLLAALVRIAQSGSAAGDTAVAVLFLALWPGLDAVFHRLRRRGAAPDELPAQILARAVEQVRRLDLRDVRRIAATILMNVERDVARADARERCRQRLAVTLDPELIDTENSRPSAMPNLLLRDVARHAGADGRIVLRVAVDGFSQVEVAAELGLSEAATRKRYQRAMRRLRTAFSDSMSRSALPPGLSSSRAHALREKEGTEHMTCIDESGDLTRMPGLFRRWEFSDVLEPRRTYRLEEAGAHADGTPLVAIYTTAAKVVDAEHSGAAGTKTGGA